MGVVVVRVRRQLARNGTFPFIDATISTNILGYDAAVCLDIVEPWIVEVFNSTRGPTSTRVLGKGGSLEDVPQIGKPKTMLEGDEPDIGRNLNSTDKYYPFRQIHTQSNRGWMLVREKFIRIMNHSTDTIHLA
jgi:hypothetical protein